MYLQIGNMIKQNYLYAKANVMNSGTAAVKLANLTKKEKHINVAQNLLKAKNTNLYPTTKNFDNRLAKNHRLNSLLLSIRFIKSDSCIEGNSSVPRELHKAIQDITRDSNNRYASKNHEFAYQLKTLFGQKLAIHPSGAVHLRFDTHLARRNAEG